MRIAIFCYLRAEVPGGISQVVRRSLEGLRKLGHAVLLIEPGGSGSSPDYPVVQFGHGSSNDLARSWKKIRSELRTFKPDIVHVHGMHSLVSLQFILKLQKDQPDLPLIFSPHMDIVRSTLAGRMFWPLFVGFFRHALDRARPVSIVCQSRSEAAAFARIFPSLVTPRVVPLGVDSIVASPKHRSAGSLMFAGHLIRRKNVGAIILGLAEARRVLGRDDILLEIVGDGPEKIRLQGLARTQGITNQIQWISFLGREDLVRKLSESRGLVLLSKSEAFGIIVAEALALGTPVLVSQAAALAEFGSEPGVTTVHNPDHAKEVAEALAEFYDRPPLVGKLSERIRTWDRVIEDYEKIYRGANTSKVRRGEE